MANDEKSDGTKKSGAAAEDVRKAAAKTTGAEALERSEHSKDYRDEKHREELEDDRRERREREKRDRERELARQREQLAEERVDELEEREADEDLENTGYPASVVLALVFGILFVILEILELCAGTQIKYLFWAAITPVLLCIWGLVDVYEPGRHYKGIVGCWIAVALTVIGIILGFC
ncbi:hypothetical protein [Bifidobacterium choloepi]|uniref:Uncharacterized protein n=1 Tax=Bifidobacterium choloepi TaxID=2614131 RepID=A0A6I5N1B2_9BIFI|nr:hypothetical protein [Bifidobacterium choloepi]NEG69429.1 hypothetical protein [Bifidobacterium choloepi]